jgi:benzoate/toluate 1,2-dioxygenase beta subunit
MNMREPVPLAYAPRPATPEVLAELTRFAFAEARLLDARRFEEWVELFEANGVYWVPSEPDQASPDDTLSLFHETRPLLLLRARRLVHPQTHVQAPASRTHHHVGNLSAFDLEEGKYTLCSMLLLVEWREGAQRMFSARCTYRIQRTEAGLRIVSKRVDLLDCDAPHRAIAIPF